MSETAGTFLYDRVAEMVNSMIASGSLKPGDRVPSLRRMSERVKVSIATVTQAYAALEERGLIEARPQSGYYMRGHVGSAPSAPKRTNPRARPRKVSISDTVQSVMRAGREAEIAPLGIANIATELLPVKGLARAMARVAAREQARTVTYCLPPGDEELRRQIALRSADLGCAVGPDDVIVTSGATEALALCLKALTRPGDVVAVESPTYFIPLQIIESLGLLALEVPTEPETGMCLDALQTTLAQIPIKAVLTVANFNNPYGSLMPEENKARLVSMLAERDIPLIEDDVYGDIYFSGTRPRIAKSFDSEGLVLTCSSFSKTLAPGYRVGWVMPGRYYDQVLNAKTLASSATASPTQLAVAEFLRAGSYERHLNRLRRACREQVEKMRFTIGLHFPEGTRISRPQGGFVLWVELPRGVDGVAVYEEALERGVSVAPGALFSPTAKFKNFIRVNAGYPWSERIEESVGILGAIVTEHRSGSG